MALLNPIVFANPSLWCRRNYQLVILQWICKIHEGNFLLLNHGFTNIPGCKFPVEFIIKSYVFDNFKGIHFDIKWLMLIYQIHDWFTYQTQELWILIQFIQSLFIIHPYCQPKIWPYCVIVIQYHTTSMISAW